MVLKGLLLFVLVDIFLQVEEVGLVLGYLLLFKLLVNLVRSNPLLHSSD